MTLSGKPDPPPSPPAQAYFRTVPHLPPGYLSEPPPDRGTMLTVTDRSDGIPCRFALAPTAAYDLMRALPGDLRMQVRPYEPKETL